jgi:hypothetical protein
MCFTHFFDDSSIIEEVDSFYSSQRLCGWGREKTLEQIRIAFDSELCDEDERPLVIIATALALCRKNELTEQTRRDALQAIDELKNKEVHSERITQHGSFEKLVAYLSEERIGPEARYSCLKRYNPGWEIGDTFIHELSQPAAERAGLAGCFVVFRKVGEYLDHKQRNIQLVYVTICRCEAIPKTDTELRSLGFLRMMNHDNKWDYLGQLSFTSKKDEQRWKLTRIGCFPNAGFPDDATEENPLVCMPFYGILNRNNDHLAYEDLVCFLYKLRGIKL